MPSEPRLPVSAARAAWRENFIRRQLAGLQALGLSEEALKREEALLRGGFTACAPLPATPDVA
jgi:hypothetical protein